MITLPNFKRGDTWSLDCTYKRQGTPVSVADISIRSQIRKSDYTMVTDLIVTKGDQATKPGTFALTPKVSDTTTWPLDKLICDIEFTSNGVVLSTETFTIPVVEEVTQ